MSLSEEFYNKMYQARVKQDKEHTAKRKPGMSASDLGYCDLKIQYKEWGMPQLNKDTEEGTWRLAHGHAVHHMLQELSLDFCSKEYQERRVEVKSLGIGGSMDDYWEEENCVVDYKTIASEGLNFGSLPKESHVRQLHVYMKGLQEEGIPADKALVYYFPKGNNIAFKPKYHKQFIDCMPFKFDEKGNKIKKFVYEIPFDEKIHQENVNQVSRIKEACQKFEKLDGVHGIKKEEWQCRFCPYADGCIGDKVADFNREIQELKEKS